jgi:hypothetical protein
VAQTVHASSDTCRKTIKKCHGVETIVSSSASLARSYHHTTSAKRFAESR